MHPVSVPFGYVLLFDAVDAMGRALYGSAWRPFREFGDERVVSYEELIRDKYLQPYACDDDLGAFAEAAVRFRRTAVIYDQTDPAVERAISTFAKACASGKIGTACRTAEGGVEVTNPRWQRGQLNVRGFFVDGRDESRAILVWEEDLDRFVAGLTPAAPPEGEPASAVIAESPVANTEPEVQPKAPDKQSEEPAVADPAQATPEPVTSAESPAAPPEPNLGGRPTDRDLLLEEADWRLRHERRPPSLAAFGRELRLWLDVHGEHRAKKTGEVMKAETIEDHIRDLWWNRHQ
jgi:hypothetical protein